MNSTLFLSSLIIAVPLVFHPAKSAPADGFDWSKDVTVMVPTELERDAAVALAISDFSDAILELYKTKTILVSDDGSNPIPGNTIFLLDTSNKNSISTWENVEVPPLAEEGYFIRSTSQGGKPILLVSGNGALGVTYGLFHLIEKLRIHQSEPLVDYAITKEPDMTLRMLTQPFEVSGYATVAHSEKPITQSLKREFDPMRPWEGAGYTAEAEAKNVLRAGLNAIWVGNFGFATLYDEYDKTILPEGSADRQWVMARREAISALVDVAEKYHLTTVASSDVFSFPNQANPDEKWELLAYSLDEFLTDYPQIDWITTRFGENYSYFNNYFEGVGIEQEEDMPEVINFVYDIVVNKHRKKYMPRTWALGNKNWGANADNYSNVIRRVSASDDIVFSVKNTRTDFWRYNRFNPVLGTGDKEQAIEILCQDSYHFKMAIPYYEVIRMARGASEFDENLGLKKAYETGVRSAWGWLTADGWCGPHIEREEWLSANIYGFSHLAWQVDSDPETLAREWAAIDFGVDITDPISETLAEILMASERLMLKIRYFEKYSRQHEGWTPARNWTRDELIGGGELSNNDLSTGKSFTPGTLKPIFNPETIAQDIAEKLEAKEIVNEMVRKYESIKDRIPDQEKADEVYHTLLYAKYLVYTLAHYANGMFRYYNGEYEKATEDLKAWKVYWTKYNTEISKLAGTATPMLDGGMVKTVEETMAQMRASSSPAEH